MIVTQAENGWWIVGGDGYQLANTHQPESCAGRLCDVHDRRGPEPFASWPLNWRDDRGVFEVICPCSIGHPSPAEITCLMAAAPFTFRYLLYHGCCGAHCPMTLLAPRKGTP